jgi:hypothetical protein
MLESDANIGLRLTHVLDDSAFSIGDGYTGRCWERLLNSGCLFDVSKRSVHTERDNLEPWEAINVQGSRQQRALEGDLVPCKHTVSSEGGDVDLGDKVLLNRPKACYPVEGVLGPEAEGVVLVWQERCFSVDLATDSKQREGVLGQIPDFCFVDSLILLVYQSSKDIEDMAAECILPDPVPELGRQAKQWRLRVGFDTTRGQYASSCHQWWS